MVLPGDEEHTASEDTRGDGGGWSRTRRDMAGLVRPLWETLARVLRPRCGVLDLVKAPVRQGHRPVSAILGTGVPGGTNAKPRPDPRISKTAMRHPHARHGAPVGWSHLQSTDCPPWF